MAKLTVREECLGQRVHFDYDGSSKNVLLSKNTPQKELEMVKFVGVDVFEKPEKDEKADNKK